MTRKQKIYASLLTSAITGFAWDFLSSNEKPAAAATDLLVHSTAAPQLGGASGGQHVDMLPRSAIASRLKLIASAEHLDPENVDSAFALGPTWVPEKPKSPTVAGQPEAAAPVDPVKDFARRHRLDAVMVRPHGGYAIVDGNGIFVGQNCERFRLVSLTHNSALFVWNDEQVELKIARPGELMKDGSVISNRTATSNGDTPPPNPVTPP